MAALSNYLEGKLIDHLFRATAFTAPTQLFFGLFTAAPGETGGGTEVTGGAYARVPVTSATTAWAAANTDGQTSNVNPITFAAPTANWGSITAVGVFDAATGGNLLIYSNLTQAKTVNNGDAAPSFPAASFTFQIDN